MNNTFILLSLLAAILSPAQVKILIVIGVLFVAANMFFLRWALKQLRVEPDNESDSAANSGVSNAIGENPVRTTVGVPRNRSLRPRDPMAEAAKSSTPERSEPELADLAYAGPATTPRPVDEITPRPGKLASFEPLIPFSPGATNAPAPGNPLPAESKSIAAESSPSPMELTTAAPLAAPLTAPPVGALTLPSLPGEESRKDEPKLSLPIATGKPNDSASARLPATSIAFDKSVAPVDAKPEVSLPVVTPAAAPAAIEASKPVDLTGAIPTTITAAPLNSPSETESKAVQLAASPVVPPADADPDDVKKTKSPKNSATAAPSPDVPEPSAASHPAEKPSPQMSGLILPPLVAMQSPEPEKKTEPLPVTATAKASPAPESVVAAPPATESAPSPAPVTKPAKSGRSRVFLPSSLEPAPAAPSAPAESSSVPTVTPINPIPATPVAEPVVNVAPEKEPISLPAESFVSTAPLTAVAVAPEVSLPASEAHPATSFTDSPAAAPVVESSVSLLPETPVVETKPAVSELLTGYEPISAPTAAPVVQAEEHVTPEPVASHSSSAVPAIEEPPVSHNKEPESTPTSVADSIISHPELAAAPVLEEDTGHLTAKVIEAEPPILHATESPVSVVEHAPAGALSLIPAEAPAEESAAIEEHPQLVAVVEKSNPNPGLTPVDALHIHGAAVETESMREELPAEPHVEPAAPPEDAAVESVQPSHHDERQSIVEEVTPQSEEQHATPADFHDLPMTALEPVPVAVSHEEAPAPVNAAPAVLHNPEPVSEPAPLAFDSHAASGQAVTPEPAVEPAPIIPTSSQAAEAPAEVAPVTTPRSNMTTTESTTSQPASGRASAQLTLGFEVTSLQLTPFFKLGAVQLRPLSNIVSLHLITTGQAESPLAAGISFQIDTVDLDENAHVRSILLKPLPQAQAAATPQPKLQVDNVQLGQGVDGPIQVTSSQGTSTAVQLLATCTIAAMDFTPAFEIGSLRLEPTSNMVLLRSAPSQRPAALDLPPSFEVANVQLEGNAQISSVRLTPSVAK